jgi:ribosomal subunit interface protein
MLVLSVSALALSLGNNLLVKTVGDLPLTEPLRAYADTKVGKHCVRYGELLTGTTLQMKVEHRGGGLHDSNHQGPMAHIAEITATCNDKHVIHCVKSSEDMYASLDLLSESFGRQLRKHKERKAMRPGDALSTGEVAASSEPMDDDDEFEPPAAVPP